MASENTDTDSVSQQYLCKLCLQPIPSGAAVCSHCQKHQNWLVRHMPNSGILISIGLLMLAMAQFYQASREREEAREAAIVARAAAHTAESARLDVKNLIPELKALESTAKQDLKEAARITDSALTKAVVSTDKVQENRKGLNKARKRQIAKEITELQREINQIQERIWNIELERGKVRNATQLRKLKGEQSHLEMEIYKRSSKIDVLEVELQALDKMVELTPSDLLSEVSRSVVRSDLLSENEN